MTIKVLICHEDGTQSIEIREVPENWLPPEPGTDTAENSGASK